MTVENVNYISDLEPDRPRGSDKISLGDDHIRNIKKSLKQTFPNIDGEVRPTDEELNVLDGVDTSKPIQDQINSGSQDLTTLEGRVKTNEDDIAVLKTDKADKTWVQGELDKKADITYVDTELDNGLAYVDGELAKKADKTYVDEELNKKADKKYVDEELGGVVKLTGDQTIDGTKTFNERVVSGKSVIGDGRVYSTDGTGVYMTADSVLPTDGAGNLAGDSVKDLGSSTRSWKDFYCDNSYNRNTKTTRVFRTEPGACGLVFQTNGQIQPTDNGGLSTDEKTDLGSASFAFRDVHAKAFKKSGGTAAQVLLADGSVVEMDDLIQDIKSKIGGGMITVVQQPATAGNFQVNGMDQTYKANVPVGSSITRTLTVPANMVFCFEYMFGVGGGTLRLDVDEIYIDGVRMYSTNQGSFDYTSSGGSIWPGNDRGPIIKVKQKIEVKNLACYNSRSNLFIAGFFAEA